MTSLRRRLVSLFVLLPLSAFALGASTWFDIPAQSLPEALRLYAHQAKMQLAYKADSVNGGTSNAVVGDYDRRAALEQLLKNTGFEVMFSKGNTATIRSVQSAARESTTARASDPAQTVQMAQAETASPSPAAGEGASKVADEDKKGSSISEIIVTAQKKTERLQDVPAPVTVVNTQALANSNQLRLQDYYSKIPGVNFQVGAGGTGFVYGNRPTISIRGITAGAADNPAVGFVIDDVPYGTSIAAFSAATAPEVDPGDLARIEVLRGPQGTLYGAGSMGGLVKFVTIDPSTDAISGRVQVGSTSVHAGGVGHSVRGAVNLPLSEKFAVRLSGFTLRDPGYVDNPLTGERDMNGRDSDGGRVSLLWQASETLSLKLNAIIQDNLKRGFDTVDTTVGGAEKFRYSALPGTGIYHDRIEAYSATLTGKLGNVELTSVTGYNTDKANSKGDFTAPAFDGFFSGLALDQFGVTGATIPASRETEKFSQEIRASIPIGSNIDWLLGVFYTEEEALLLEQQLAADPATGETVGVMVDFNASKGRSTFDERAVFTNVDLRITDRFDIQVGGRMSYIEQTSPEIVRSGPNAQLFFNEDPSILPKRKGDERAFTYLVTPRFKVSPDLMMYARLASGYRPGGFNAGFGASGVPNQYEHDTTRNYELGVKGSTLAGVLSFDASLYRIDWTNLPINLSAPGGAAYTDNAGNARSEGVELSAEARPFAGMTIAGWVAWNDAAVTEPYNGQPAGSRLPFSSRWSGNLSVDQEFPLASSMKGFVGASVSYVDDRAGSIAGFPLFLPSYVQTDFHCGLRYNSWALDAFVNNVANKRGVLAGIPGADSLLVFTQPRTVGVNLTRDF